MTHKSILALLAISLGLISPLTAKAANTASSSSSTDSSDSTQTQRTASIEVLPGTLSFNSDTASDISFGSLNVKNLTKLDKLSTNPQRFSTGATKNLVIDNYLGTGDQWSVYAKLSSFTDGTKQHTMFGTMTISPNTNGQKDESGIDLNSGKTVQLNFGEKESDDIPIYSATADHGMGKVTLPINYQLNVTQAKYKGTYTAKLTYTFTKTPTTAVGS